MLSEGKICLEKALALAPEEEYIKNHLHIVTRKLKTL